MSSTLDRWRGRLKIRQRLLAAAKKRAALRAQQVAEAQRVIRRHTPKPKPTRAARVSDKGVAFIADFEGGQSKDGLFHAYRDPVGVWTIGYGHTEGVGPGSKALSKAQALALLKADLNEKYAPPVIRLSVPLNQNQFDALVSFVYNLGPGVIGPGTRVGKALRAKQYEQAADAMLAYDHAGGQVLAGLSRRRQAERRMFLS